MLKDIRRSVNTFSIKLLMILLVLSFVLFYGYETTSSCSPGSVAKVRGTLISQSEFTSRLRVQMENYRRVINRDLDESLFGFFRQSILEGLVNNTLLFHEAQQLGIEVGDAILRRTLEENFSNPETKQFDLQFYKNYVMRYLRSSPKQYEEQLRADLTASKLRSFLERSVKVSSSELEASVVHKNRQVNFEFIAVDPQSLETATEVSDDDLQQYYEEHQSDFLKPAERKIEYLHLRSKDYQKSENEERQETDKKVKADAEKLLARLKARPEDSLQEVIGKINATYKTTGYFAKSDTIPGIPDSNVVVNNAFALKVGELSNVVKGWLSGDYYILRVVEERPPQQRSFDEVKAEVQINYMEVEKVKQAERLVDRLLAKVRSGEAFTETAQKFGLKADETGFFRQSDGQSIPKIGYSKEAYTELFSLAATGDQLLKKPLKIAGSYYIFRAKAEKTADATELQEALEKERTDLLADKRRLATTEWTKWVRDSAEAAGDIVFYEVASQGQNQ